MTIRKRKLNQATREARATPCVVCGARPTVAFCYAPPAKTGLKHGRVCKEHALAAAKAGVGVAGDGGGVRNWGTAA